MRNRFFFISIGLFVFLSSCREQRQVVQQTTFDSSRVEFRDIEKVIKVPGDTVRLSMQIIKAPFDTLRNKKDIAPDYVPSIQIVETSRATVRLEITKTGEIKATEICKELEEKVTVQEKTIRTSSNHVIVEKPKESWFQKTVKEIRTWAIWIIVAIALFIILRFLNPFINLLKTLFK